MIYESVREDEPLRQGDIFHSIPRVELSLATMAVLSSDDGPEETAWNNLIQDGLQEPVTAVVAIEAVTAIVISQNCDAARGEEISLCAIEPLESFLPKAKRPTKSSKWINQLLKHAHSPRYFYLPQNPEFGFKDGMTADFRGVIRLRRDDILTMRQGYRMGRLNCVAREHLRESLAQFFRRYPVNEWYPLTKEEAEEYAAERQLEQNELYDWQK